MRWTRTALLGGGLLGLILAAILAAVALRDVDATRRTLAQDFERNRLIEQALLAGMYVQRMKQLEHAMYQAPVWKGALETYQRAREEYMAAFGYVVARRIDLPKLKDRMEEAVREGRTLQDYSSQVVDRAWQAMEAGTPISIEAPYQGHDKLTEFFHRLQEGLKTGPAGSARHASELRLEQAGAFLRYALLLVQLAMVAVAAVLALQWWKRRKPGGPVPRAKAEDAQQAWISIGALHRSLAERLAGEPTGRQPCAVLMVELANGGQIAQSHGSGMAEQLIRKCVERVNRSLPQEDQVARLSGYELAVFLREADAARAQRVAMRLSQALVKSTTIGHTTLYPTVRIGGAVAPQDGEEAGLLLERARRAAAAVAAGAEEAYAFHVRSELEVVDPNLLPRWAAGA